MSAPWTGTAAPAATSQATFAITSTGQGQVPRLQALSASLVASTAATGLLQITDGSSGTVLLSLLVATPSTGGAPMIALSGLDYRASGSNPLVVGFASGISAVLETVNANGDFVQIGLPAFAAPVQS